MAIALPRGQAIEWLSRPTRRGAIVGRPWSANDVIMVVVWVLILPHAAARFEHEILVPPVRDLSAGVTFLIASAAALMELSVAALLARLLGTVLRKALRNLACRLWSTRRPAHCGRHPARMRFRRTPSRSPTPAVTTYALQV